jgi:hypothetical protein
MINRGHSKRDEFSDIAIGLALRDLVPATIPANNSNKGTDTIRYRDGGKARRYFYRFPSLEICRKGMDKFMGSGRDWSECLQDEWVREPFDRGSRPPIVFDSEQNDRSVKALMSLVEDKKKDEM